MSCLYGIVDAARDPRLYEWSTLSPDHVCLFAGELKPPLERVSPYLVKLSGQSALAKAWRAEGWGQSWGILCASSASLDELRRHFRQFLQAAMPNGQIVLFRFYDPRVFRTYLRTCDGEALAAWFACVDEFRVEAMDASDSPPFETGTDGLETRSGRQMLSFRMGATGSEAQLGRGRLCITQPQMEAFRLAAGEQFVSRSIQHPSAFRLSKLHSSENSATQAEVLDGLKIARRENVLSEVGVVRFLEARTVLGPGFPDKPEHAWALRLLRCESADLDRTLEHIRDTALEKAGK